MRERQLQEAQVARKQREEVERLRRDQERARLNALERQREAEEALRRAEAQTEQGLLYTISRDIDLRGDVLDIHFSLDLAACRARCDSVPVCVGFTLGPQGTCHTYHKIASRRPFAGYTAGERRAPGGGGAPPLQSTR